MVDFLEFREMMLQAEPNVLINRQCSLAGRRSFQGGNGVQTPAEAFQRRPSSSSQSPITSPNSKKENASRSISDRVRLKTFLSP